MPVRRDRCLVVLLGVVAGAAALAGVDVGLLLLLAPAVLLAVPLLSGRYLGERRLARLRGAFRPRRVRATRVLSARLPRLVRAVAADGGMLLAAALDGRGPPAAAVRRF